MIMDGANLRIGAVGSLGRVKDGIGVARAVMEHTEHTLLVGDRATEFAKEMGFQIEDLSTEASIEKWAEWKRNGRQPNFRTSVGAVQTDTNPLNEREAHDTVGIIAIDSGGKMAAATSTNGATFKVPGRVGDSPIPGSGCYVDDAVGGAVATGDGDVLMRFLPSYLVVEMMRSGERPQTATKHALDRISTHCPHYEGAVLAISRDGEYGASCTGFKEFSFCVRDATMEKVKVVEVECRPHTSHPNRKSER